MCGGVILECIIFEVILKCFVQKFIMDGEAQEWCMFFNPVTTYCETEELINMYQDKNYRKHLNNVFQNKEYNIT